MYYNGVVVETADLTERQYQILKFIAELVEERGLPPTIREIGARFSISSTAGVRRHLEALERKGYLRRRGARARGLELVREKAGHLFRKGEIPVVGRVAAGRPILAVENIEDLISLEKLFPAEEHFALRIEGDSMIDAGILDRDIVIVRRQPTADIGDIVVALLEEEATVKQLAMLEGKLHLRPANPRYEPIPAEHVEIVGKVVGLIRRLR